jgi:hypothetical protein
MIVSDPSFAPPTALPFPAGTSPFRQKGNGYLGDVEYFERNVVGGTAAVMANIKDATVRTFLTQRFRSSEWYDAFPCTVLHVSAARIRGVTFAEHRRQVGAYHAREAAGGIYRTLLRVVSNENIAMWGLCMSSIYFEFGKTETRSTTDKEVLVVRHGMPAGLVQFVLYASKGFCEESLVLAGAKTASFQIGEIQADGHSYSQQLYKASFVLRWA